MSVDDKPIKSVGDLVKEIQKKKIGQKVKLNIIREGNPLTVEVATSAMPEKAELEKRKE
jgi:S1-C subfamily serine protease